MQMTGHMFAKCQQADSGKMGKKNNSTWLELAHVVMGIELLIIVSRFFYLLGLLLMWYKQSVCFCKLGPEEIERLKPS